MTRLIIFAGLAWLAWYYFGPKARASPPDTDRARRLLGVGPTAGRDEIVAAHRRLVARVHPDAGGSEGLAAELNAARDLLLRQLG